MKITYSNTINFEKNSKEHIDCMFTDNQNVKLTAFDIVKIINNLKCYQKFNQKKFTYKDEDGELVFNSEGYAEIDHELSELIPKLNKALPYPDVENDITDYFTSLEG